jgi:GntR family transcriptional regulator
MRKSNTRARRSTAAAFRPARGKPLYHHIFETLRDRINAGRYKDGAFLPGEHEISSLFGVSRITAKRALDEIAAAGLAVRQQGRGTVVRRTSRQTSVQGTVVDFAGSMKRHEPSVVVRLHEFSQVPANAEVAEVLGLAIGDPVQRAIRVWHGEKGPFSHLTTFVPADIASSWTAADLERMTLALLMRQHGVRMVRAEESITATLADAAVAARLKIDVGAPLLSVTRRVYDAKDRVVELLWALHPPARYRYDISITQSDHAIRGRS